ncbi:DUF5710 domain-containing protein [Streptococcus ratti]|uniref:DNA primase n=1 Tax=Streptococcus ratti FA-1 = DSM 20564 TaxID=699248 RepID=A0ABN0GX10_STRRT|nr:DUF5710 domain-containing protein [Streptococcus ratti]EJN95053.1 putative DNA primase [Streptococcus ratti FA-1 = DSM 20564]EMP70513.1 putative DNA primase [Streptococcus ratti FA-1 = DSM 20564]QEY07053.1 DNA primase [Streptococcus ratti]VEI59476.1 DNA primase TraC [Streptococcus mutans]
MSFLSKFFRKKIKPVNQLRYDKDDLSIRLFLDVPYSEKDEAKQLGAKWHPQMKKWYTQCEREDYVRFSKWLLKRSDDVIIATDYLYIIEGHQECWKCKQSTLVVGLGIGEYIHIFGDLYNAEIEIVEDSVGVGEEVHLAWTEKESDIPPKLLNYLKEHYFVKMMYSKTLGKHTFANYCQHCNVLQGNWFLFSEPDSPLSTCVEGAELESRMNKLKIRMIPIEDDLIVKWDVEWCSNDFAYLKFGKTEELVLSTVPSNDCVSYEELYTVE